MRPPRIDRRTRPEQGDRFTFGGCGRALSVAALGTAEAVEGGILGHPAPSPLTPCQLREAGGQALDQTRIGLRRQVVQLVGISHEVIVLPLTAVVFHIEAVVGT